MGANLLLVAVAAFLALAFNTRFWAIVFGSQGSAGAHGVGVVAAVAVALFAITLLMLLPFGFKGAIKPVLVAVLLLSAIAAYFIDGYGAVIDRHALASVYETDVREAAEWLSWRMLFVIAALGILPALAVCWVKVPWRKPVSETLARLKLGAVAVVLLAASASLYGKDVASLLRNRMELRHIANPFALLAAHLSYWDHLGDGDRPLRHIGKDAHRTDALPSTERPLVLVLVIGESTRAQSIDLNGYARDTDVDLHPVPIVNFSHVSSCGTNTATSVPCMFSGVGRSDYEDGMAKRQENLLDVLRRGGYDVVWLDNNTGSKGLAKRSRELFLGNADDPKRCNAEGCYDEILTDALAAELPKIQRDTVIVLHMLGSHGPAYYARYPREFAAFQPECRTNQLQQCSDQQLKNTYDNTVLYTTHVLSQVVAQLGETAAANPPAPKTIACRARLGHVGADRAADCGESAPAPVALATTSASAALGLDAAMLFVSDHGESLGEKCLYLHGAPYAIAPDEQTHVPMLFWASRPFFERRDLDIACLLSHSDKPLSHDHFFHSVLGLGGVGTQVYDRSLDLFADCEPG